CVRARLAGREQRRDCTLAWRLGEHSDESGRHDLSEAWCQLALRARRALCVAVGVASKMTMDAQTSEALPWRPPNAEFESARQQGARQVEASIVDRALDPWVVRSMHFAARLATLLCVAAAFVGCSSHIPLARYSAPHARFPARPNTEVVVTSERPVDLLRAGHANIGEFTLVGVQE